MSSLTRAILLFNSILTTSFRCEDCVCSASGLLYPTARSAERGVHVQACGSMSYSNDLSLFLALARLVICIRGLV
jgi:hypothetical protein